MLVRSAVGILLAIATLAGHAAITVQVKPTSMSVVFGGQFDVSIVIDGLGDKVAPSLGVFDVDVVFDPTALGFDSALFGDPVLGNQLDIAGLGSVTNVIEFEGMVNLLEVSLDPAPAGAPLTPVVMRH